MYRIATVEHYNRKCQDSISGKRREYEAALTGAFRTNGEGRKFETQTNEISLNRRQIDMR